ncbi:MAG: ComEA family DNA-binding protein [Halothiobacillaceae bacterium]
MSFLNIGKKDEYGRQRRIEHRGRFLRASRTGGVALRAQAKVAGLTLSGNTTHGLRVSATPIRNTQVAFQNGRFILRGRYGRGPTKLNLSKSGATVSTRNALGTFNWIKPNRSSAKIAGIQWRGKTAAHMQMAYLAILGLFSLIPLLVLLVIRGVQALLWLLRVMVLAFLAVPSIVQELRRRVRNWLLERRFPACSEAPSSPEDLAAAAALIITCWGRGRSVRRAPVAPAGDSAGRARCALLAAGRRHEAVMRWRVRGWESSARRQRQGHLACMAWLGKLACERFDAGRLAQLAYELDDCARAEGDRTRLQEMLLEVFCDFAGLRFEWAEPEPAPDPAGEAPAPSGRWPESPARGMVDLNRASLEQLEAIPHIGPERALQIVAMRPIRRLDDLRAIHGIGPQRLADIQAHGVTLGGQDAEPAGGPLPKTGQ